MERIKSFLQVVLFLVVIALIIYNIKTGLTVQTIGIPGIIEIHFGEPKSSSVESPPSSDNTSKLASKYTMDQEEYRVIVVTYLSDSKYRIEEPSGSYPWEGTATLDGGQLSGDAKFKESFATMRVEGALRSDGTIDVQYIFITDGDGNPANGRVDRHVWYPVP